MTESVTIDPAERPAKRLKRLPRFSTYTEVEVDIEPEELERAGWRYVGDDDEEEIVDDERVVDIVVRWHEQSHGDPWRWCQHPLCNEVRRA